MTVSAYIKNFKSIETLDLTINNLTILTGEPDSGKTNILEALALPSFVSYVPIYYKLYGRKLVSSLPEKFLRARTTLALIRDYMYGECNTSLNFSAAPESLYLEASCNVCPETTVLELHYEQYIPSFPLGVTETGTLVRISTDLNFIDIKLDTIVETQLFDCLCVRFYKFVASQSFLPPRSVHDIVSKIANNIPLPPEGVNLPNVVEENEKARKIVQDFAENLGYDDVCVLRSEREELFSIYFLKRKRGRVIAYPLHIVAGSLTPLLVYLIALEVSVPEVLGKHFPEVVILSEPENLISPYYTKLLADVIAHKVNKSDNVYIVLVTNSPYMLATLIEKTSPDKLALYWVYRDKDSFATKCIKLSKEDIEELVVHGTDVFFPLRSIVEEKLAEHRQEEKR